MGSTSANGSIDLVNIAQCALKSIRDAGYTPQPDDKITRFTGLGITKWQTMLYAVNELPDWHFPDDVLCVGWLIECGGPSMGRGPAKAQFEDRVKHYVGGTRNRYNRGTFGHGGDGFPESREYSLEECPHVGSHPEPSDDSVPSASSVPPRTSTSTPSPATSNEEELEGDRDNQAGEGAADAMYCINCGEEVVEAANFCAACGAKAHVGSRPEPSDDSVPSASSVPPRTSTSTPSPATSNEEELEGDRDNQAPSRGSLAVTRGIMFSFCMVLCIGTWWLAVYAGGHIAIVIFIGGFVFLFSA